MRAKERGTKIRGWLEDKSNKRRKRVSLTISHSERSVTFYLPFQARLLLIQACAPPPSPFDLHRRRIRNTSGERRKSGFYFPPGNQSPNLSFLGQSYQRDKTFRARRRRSHSAESIRAKIGGKRARTEIQAAASAAGANSSEKKTWFWSRARECARDALSHPQSSPLSAAINILICTGPSTRATVPGIWCVRRKSAQHDGWSSPPPETFPEKTAHTICQLWKLIFETFFLLGIINVF